MAEFRTARQSSSKTAFDASQSAPRPRESQDGGGSNQTLTPAQLHALFNLLTHHQTYAEVESFKYPDTIAKYGYPFALNSSSNGSELSAPLLSSFLGSIVLPLPGVRDLPPDFWSVTFQGLMVKLAEAELSESYDKGAVGTRKTLATISSVVHECISRGSLGGFPDGFKRDLHSSYDTSRAEDLARAWDDGMHELVYGNLIDELFDWITENDSLEQHSPAVRAASDYVHIHLATLLHHIFVLSPEGQYLLKLLENIHQLIPYSMIKQTLRIGNAAGMINGMIKLMLAKVSVGAFSNWIGLTQNADDGVNLLQRIVTLVLSWDSSNFRKSAERVEKAKDGPLKEYLATINQHIQSSREEHEAARARSQEKAESIVVAILQKSRPDLLPSLSESDHIQLLEYYSARLSVRDRGQITKILCRQNPDLFTQLLRDLVASFDAIIRTIHEKLDIREHLSAMESFLNDFIKTSRPEKAQSRSGKTDPVPRPPSVEDYVRLLQRNNRLLYAWLHQFAANCPDLRESFRAWAKDTIRIFRQEKDNSNSPQHTRDEGSKGSFPSSEELGPQSRQSGAGDMSLVLQGLFTNLPGEVQAEVLTSLDAHATYLTNLERLSLKRMQAVIDNLAAAEQVGAPRKSGTSTLKLFGAGLNTGTNTPAPLSGASTPVPAASMAGPGMYLCRWQALLDQTSVTPATLTGQPRSGRQIKGSTTVGKMGAEGTADAWNAGFLALEAEKDVPVPPNVEPALGAFLFGFRKIVAETKGQSNATAQ